MTYIHYMSSIYPYPTDVRLLLFRKQLVQPVHARYTLNYNRTNAGHETSVNRACHKPEDQ